MIKKVSTEIQIKYDTTAGELAKLLASVPSGASVEINTEKYYDQLDPGGTWIKLSWTEEM